MKTEQTEYWVMVTIRDMLWTVDTRDFRPSASAIMQPVAGPFSTYAAATRFLNALAARIYEE